MSNTYIAPTLPPSTRYIYRKKIESQYQCIQQLKAVIFKQQEEILEKMRRIFKLQNIHHEQDNTFQHNQTILKLQDRKREQEREILYLRNVCLLQQEHIEKQANSLVRMRLSLNQHSTNVTSIKSDIRKIADYLMETQNSAQQTSSELPDRTLSESAESCVAKLELLVKEILSSSMAGLGHERRD